MKQIALIILVFFMAHNSYGQDSLVYPYEGKFDYALVENAKIYISIRAKKLGYSGVIRMKRIDTSSIPIFHYCSDSDNNRHPFAWCKSENNLFSVAFWLSFNQRTRVTRIYYREFETRDSIKMVLEPKDEVIKEKVLLNNPITYYLRSFIKHPPIPRWDVMQKIVDTLSFDIHAPDDNNLIFYLRDPDAFYIWECNLPTEGRIGKWQQLTVYARPEIDMEYPPRKYSDIFNKKKVKFNAIKDSLFMDGHFKVIIQNGNTFVINRKYGNIYLLTKKEIVHIGKVLFENNYPKLAGKALFIEDRDNNEIIFFAKVKWINNKYPKPQVKIMNKKEMQKKFKYVLE